MRYGFMFLVGKTQHLLLLSGSIYSCWEAFSREHNEMSNFCSDFFMIHYDLSGSAGGDGAGSAFPIFVLSSDSSLKLVDILTFGSLLP